MRIKTAATFACLFAFMAHQGHAALSPRYQNIKDVEAMLAFVDQHERVAMTLKSIDVQRAVVHFADNCRAEFTRKGKPKPPGWAGPADPLVFARSNCKIE